MSELLYQSSCPVCPSSDAFSVYDSGWGHCFSCGKNRKVTDTNNNTKEGADVIPMRHKHSNTSLLNGEIHYKKLNKRALTEETCRKWGYGVSKYKNSSVQVAQYRSEGGPVVSQKLRFADKTFIQLGNPKQALLFGQHLWAPGGNMIVVTEGEIDAMSVSQAQDNKWPVVSVPNGAQGAAKSIQQSIEYLESFNKVVFMFDMDEPGQLAAKECAELLSPGRAYIASIPAKDPNELLQQGKTGDIVKSIWNATPYRPDGIIMPDELIEVLKSSLSKKSYSYPWESFNILTRGLRFGELVTIASGSGMGKSQICRQITQHLLKEHGHKVGYIALEESLDRTAMGLLSLELEKPLHLYEDRLDYETTEVQSAIRSLNLTSNLYLYDHFGSLDSTNLLNKIRYLARGCGCQWIVLDHISIVVSGIAEGDERRVIDNIMTKLRSLVQELDIGLILVSHLKRPSTGKGHEEGAATSLSDLRGSTSIAQLSDMVIGLERNQQAVKNKNITTARVLKNRYTGETGIIGYLKYDPATTILHDVVEPAEDDFEEIDDDGEDY